MDDEKIAGKLPRTKFHWKRRWKFAKNSKFHILFSQKSIKKWVFAKTVKTIVTGSKSYARNTLFHFSNLTRKNLLTIFENNPKLPKNGKKSEICPKFSQKLTEPRQVVYQNDPYDTLNTVNVEIIAGNLPRVKF